MLLPKAPTALTKWSAVVIASGFTGFIVYTLTHKNRVIPTVSIVISCNIKINQALKTATTSLNTCITKWVEWYRLWTSKKESPMFLKNEKRIVEGILWYDENSSAKRTKVLEDNDQRRTDIFGAHSRGESLAHIEVINKSLFQLTEVVQLIKSEQEKKEERAIQAQKKKEMAEMSESTSSESNQYFTEKKDFSSDESEMKHPSDLEDDVGVEFTANIKRMSSLFVQQGVQAFSGLFFGSSRAGL